MSKVKSRKKARQCFLCDRREPDVKIVDKKPPYRCAGCFNAVAANEADGEL